MITIAKLRAEISADNSGLVSGLRQSEQAIADTKKNIDGMSASAAKAGAVMTAAITAPAIGAVRMGLGFLDLKAKAEIAFESMFNDADKARKMVGELQEFAATTPFDFPGLLTMGQRMMAMGESAERVIPNLRAIGDAVASMGRGPETVDQITMALGQMLASGRTNAMVFRQMASAGINATDILAKAAGTTNEKMREMVSQGLVPARWAFDALIDGMGRQAPGAMERMSGTLTTGFSNLRDFSAQVLGTLMEPLYNDVSRAIIWITGKLAEIRDVIGTWSDETKQRIVAAMGGLAAVGPLLLAFAGAAKALTILVSPLGALAIVLASLGAYLMSNRDAAQRLWETFQSRIPDILAMMESGMNSLLSIGESLWPLIESGIPILLNVIDVATSILNLFAQLPAEVQAGVILLIAMAGPLSSLIGVLGTLFAGGAVTVGVIAGIAAIGAAWYFNVGGMQDKSKAFFEWIVTNWSGIVSLSRDAIMMVVNDFNTAVQFMRDAWNTFTRFWDDSISKIRNVWKRLADFIPDAMITALKAVTNAVREEFGIIGNIISSLTNALRIENPFTVLQRAIEGRTLANAIMGGMPGVFPQFAERPSDVNNRQWDIATRAMNREMRGEAKRFQDECQKLLRTTVQTVTNEFDAYWRDSAKATMNAFKQAGIGQSYAVVQAAGGLRPGDLIYSGKGEYGHAEIVGPEGRFYDQYGRKSKPTHTPEWIVRQGGFGGETSNLASALSLQALPGMDALVLGANDAEDATKRLNDQYDRMADNLRRGIALHGDTTEVAQLRYDLEHTELRNLSGAQKAYLIQLATQQDALNVATESREKASRDAVERLQKFQTEIASLQQTAADFREEIALGANATRAQSLEYQFAQTSLEGFDKTQQNTIRSTQSMAVQLAKVAEANKAISVLYEDRQWLEFLQETGDIAEQNIAGMVRAMGGLKQFRQFEEVGNVAKALDLFIGNQRIREANDMRMAIESVNQELSLMGNTVLQESIRMAGGIDAWRRMNNELREAAINTVRVKMGIEGFTKLTESIFSELNETVNPAQTSVESVQRSIQELFALTGVDRDHPAIRSMVQNLQNAARYIDEANANSEFRRLWDDIAVSTARARDEIAGIFDPAVDAAREFERAYGDVLSYIEQAAGYEGKIMADRLRAAAAENAALQHRAASMSRLRDIQSGITQQAMELSARNPFEAWLATLYEIQITAEGIIVSLPEGWDRDQLKQWFDLDQNLKMMGEFAQGMRDIFTQMTKDIFEGGFKRLFSNIYEGFRTLLARMAAEYLQSLLVRMLMNVLSNIFGSAFGQAFGATSGSGVSQAGASIAKAYGGGVNASNLYLVGERGPEIFVPTMPGTIIPHHQMVMPHNLIKRQLGGRVSAGSAYYVGESGEEMFIPDSAASKIQDGGNVYNFNFTIQTPDAESFRRSQSTIISEARDIAERQNRRLK